MILLTQRLQGILVCVGLCLTIMAGGAAVADSAPILGISQPSLSPDGRTICFSYLGDLWTVPAQGGQAIRLTVHEANEGSSCWSPDGNFIAFTSDRSFNPDVFVVPSDGGLPRKLTFNSRPDVVRDWSADGKWIIFDSYREVNAPLREGTIYRANADGTQIKRVIDCTGRNGVLSPDGQTLAFVRGAMPWWRKDYHGSSDQDVWLKQLDGSPAKRLTQYDGKDTDPMWSPDGKKIYFLSDRDGVTNVWVMPTSGGEARKVSNFTTDGAAFASISRDGSVIACCLNGRLYTVDTRTGETTRVDVFAPADVKENNVEPKTYTSKASEMALSPDGQQIAFVVRGEVFAMKRTGGEAMRLTSNAARDYGLAWSPDSRKLAFVSDRRGTRDIFVMESADRREPMLAKSRLRKITPLATSEAEEFSPKWSPDSSRIAYLVDRGDLWVMNPDGSGKRMLAKGPDIRSIGWSPDSRWIACSKDVGYWITDIFIISVKSGKMHNITQSASQDYMPVWSPDGTRIFFLSDREGYIEEWGESDVWQVFLTKEVHEDYLRRRQQYREDLPDEEQEELLATPLRKTARIRIDFAGIDRRVERVTSLSGTEWALAVSHDGLTCAFSSRAIGKWETYAINEFGMKLRKIVKIAPRQIVWGPKDERVFVLGTKGSITVAHFEDKGTAREKIRTRLVPYVAKMEIDHKAERRQMFLEAWRGLNTYFYDANFHGVNWAAVRDKYLPLLDSVQTHEGFLQILLQMAGELKASHVGAWGGGAHKWDIAYETGRLGLRFDQRWTGDGLKVARVIKNGPCDKPGSEVKVGEVITAIDGAKVSKELNYWKLLNGKVGKKVDLLVARKPGGKTRTVTVKPVAWWGLYQNTYKMWVAARKTLVDKLSHGRIGYIHVQGMNMRSFRTFLRELTTEVRDKEALIVDVRYNGGGYTHDRLLSVLGRPAYFYLQDRSGAIREYQPTFHWEKPAVTLTNQYSFSDAEIFPFSFRKLGLGKLIGVPTGSAVIGTGGIRLLDGTWFRIPSSGCYTLEGKTLENMGIKPDIYVEDPPEQDFSTTTDAQLEMAVEVLLKQLSNKQ